MATESQIIKATDRLLHRLSEINLGNWTTFRYAVSKSKMTSFEPIGTSVSLGEPLDGSERDVMNIPLYINKETLESSDIVEVFLDPKTWENNIMFTIYFPLLCSVDGVPTLSVVSLTCTPTGIMSVYVASLEACDRLQDMINIMSDNDIDLVPKAIENYVRVEKPVKTINDIDKGFFSIQEDSCQGFSFDSSFNNNSKFSLQELNQKILELNIGEWQQSEISLPDNIDTLSEMFENILKDTDMSEDLRKRFKEIYEDIQEKESVNNKKSSAQSLSNTKKVETFNDEEDSDEWI